MPLRFRSFAPYTLPGVLALIGWWWYISRKKARPASLQAEEEGAAPAMGLLSSPTEVSNGLLERACCQPTSTSTVHRRPSRDRPKTIEPKSTEQELLLQQEVVVVVAAQVHSPLVRAVEAEAESISISRSPSLGLGRTEVPQVSTPHLRKGREAPTQSSVECQQKTTEADLATEKSSSESERDALSCSDAQQIHVDTGKPSVTPLITAEPTAAKEMSPDVDSEALRLAATHSDRMDPDVEVAVELTKDARPEPEGEVAAEETPHTQPAPKTLHETLRDATPYPSSSSSISTSSITKEEPAPMTLAAKESRQEPPFLHPETPTAHHVTSPLFTSTPTGPDEATSEGQDQWQVENGIVSQLREDGESKHVAQQLQEYERVAAGLITEVISAAAQQVQMTGSCEDVAVAVQTTPSQTTPVPNGRPCSADSSGQEVAANEEASMQETQTQGPPATEQSDKEMTNGCLTAPTWERYAERMAEKEQTTVTTTPSDSLREPAGSHSKLQADETQTVAEDSGCCQSEDGISGEDLPLHATGLPQVAPDTKEGPVQASSSSLLSSKIEEVRPTGSPTPVVLEEAVLAQHEAATALRPQLTAASLRNGAHLISEAETDQSGSDVNSMDSVDSGCTLGAGEGSSSLPSASSSSEVIVWEIEVPKHLVGRLIGKQGRYVSFLKQSSGAKIYISTLPYTQEFQICHMEGTQQQVDKALALIGKKFKDLDLTNLYAPPPAPLTLPSLPMTSWLLLPNGVTVEVIVVNIVSPGHMFVQQHTHPTYHALRSLDQQMFLCYSQPGTPALPTPIEVGVICAAPAGEGAWWRAQVISFYKDSNEVEIRYVDYGGYERVKIDTLRQIRSDFVTLPFQGTEVLLDNLLPLPGEDRFSTEGNAALEEMTRGVPLLAQVTNYDNNTGLPMVQMWNMVGDELVLLNRTLAERGFGNWVDNF
ncbi:A kinase (PRKA) anchor protein 1b [Clupea harengus]|uniref:A kinase (PRKA) anchor protein 1b n=1 Tax=Clupea harengus TaxID=7950 RepID=A0A6P8FN49_CLUHA|nr:A kinase (PRKA) anchor protein 1b [Clupea harengus]XP_031429633.1 A kinase (PRKA) anchor protein 1b [Clupea harengus]